MPRRAEREERTCINPECGKTFVAILNAAQANQRCCSRSCARKVDNQARSARMEAEWLTSEASLCACGKGRIPYAVRHTTKYHTPACRAKYGKKKQANPDNYVTFTCLHCGTEVTRYRKYGNGHSKYCSNACAQRHTKTKVHIVVDDAVVLDSSWEALFWGLCGFLKIPVERYDRDQGVEWQEGHWYAPDFRLTLSGLAVEVKGQAEPEDLEKWMAYEAQRGSLSIITQADLDALRSLDRDTFLMYLHQDVPVV